MFNKQNKTSLSEYLNSYRNGQGCNGTQTRLVPLQTWWPLRYSFQYSDNDVLLDNNVYGYKIEPVQVKLNSVTNNMVTKLLSLPLVDLHLVNKY